MAKEIAFATLTMFRRQETQRAYNKEHIAEKGARVAGLANAACKFCTFHPGHEAVLETHGNLAVIPNLYPYDQWDAREVQDHKLVVPMRHVDSLGDLTGDERNAWFDIVGKYEAEAYTTFTRAPSNPGKSIEHLHTHLIKIDLASRAVRYLHYDGANGVSEFRFASDTGATETAS